jgi:sugar phosphate isomerase/epimerase
MKLAFSNIAFPTHDAADVWALLRTHGVTGIEVAPTKVWPDWEEATPAAARAYRTRLADAGFEVPALQAVLFGQPAARLFDAAGEKRMGEHLRRVAELAGALGARAVVLGAPKQRDRGTLSMDQAQTHAVPLLRAWAQPFADQASCLCIEPNPRRYGCNFIVNAQEGAALVAEVNHPGFGLHLDAAGMFLEGDWLEARWPEVTRLLRHFHISEPDLGDFRQSQVPHLENFRVLRTGGYTGWCSVEMREPAAGLVEAGPWRILGAAQ